MAAGLPLLLLVWCLGGSPLLAAGHGAPSEDAVAEHMRRLYDRSRGRPHHPAAAPLRQGNTVRGFRALPAAFSKGLGPSTLVGPQTLPFQELAECHQPRAQLDLLSMSKGPPDLLGHGAHLQASHLASQSQMHWVGPHSSVPLIKASVLHCAGAEVRGTCTAHDVEVVSRGSEDTTAGYELPSVALTGGAIHCYDRLKQVQKHPLVCLAFTGQNYSR
uniref:Uncharacterized protein n=1 Tax=Sphaerodactylus townsendi TaxID=933632 RepID=A0ACB8E8S6_9SAUR